MPAGLRDTSVASVTQHPVHSHPLSPMYTPPASGLPHAYSPTSAPPTSELLSLSLTLSGSPVQPLPPLFPLTYPTSSLFYRMTIASASTPHHLF